MTSNHKLTGVLQGRTINGTSNSGDTLTIHFTDGSQMTVQTTGSSNSASSGGTIKAVRQQGTTLALDFEAGEGMELPLAEETSSVMVRGKDGTMEPLPGCAETVIDAGEAVIIQPPTAGGYGEA